MGTETTVWLAAVAAPPAAAIAAFAAGLRGRRLYLLASVAASVLAVVSAAPLASHLRLGPGGGAAVLELAGLNGHPLWPLPLVLVPFAALLWLLTVLVTPTAHLDEGSVARSAGVCLLTMAAFVTWSPWLLVLLWAGTAAAYLGGHTAPRFARARKVATAYMGLSTVLLAAGALVAAAGEGRAVTLASVGLVMAAAMIREGIFPFHAWIPEVFDRGRVGPATMFCAPQLGTYVALVVASPAAPAGLLRAVAVLALVTTLYAALLALHQEDARRACGYLYVSQSSLVIAGLDMPGREALVGAMILLVSSGLALAGLSRCVLVLEARRGRLSLKKYHGGYERMSVLAICFLVLGLAITGFPATLGFLGSEMLVRGAVESFPSLGLSVVAAGALTGIAVLRMYFSLFCGRRDSGAHLKLLRSEGFGFAVAALLLIGFGLAPGGLVRLLDRAGAAALERRGGSEADAPQAYPSGAAAAAGR